MTIASPVYLRPSGLIRMSLSGQWRSTTATSPRPTPLPCAGTYSLLQWLAKKRDVPETALQSLRNESAAFVPSSELVLHLSCSVRLRAESRNELRNRYGPHKLRVMRVSEIFGADAAKSCGSSVSWSSKPVAS